jgi:hypothetical protein
VEEGLLWILLDGSKVICRSWFMQFLIFFSCNLYAWKVAIPTVIILTCKRNSWFIYGTYHTSVVLQLVTEPCVL